MKPSLHFFPIIPLLILCLSINTRSQVEYFYHECPNDSVFTRQSIYETNLNLTLSSLASNANRSAGFYEASAGNTTFGLFLCQGGLAADVCQNYVNSAIQDLRRRCPVEANAMAWYDGLFIRYSNESFFSKMETSPINYVWTGENYTNESAFNDLLASNMGDAAAQAAQSRKKIAVKEANFTVFRKLYSLVQCSPDISSSDCSRCLVAAISELMDCCGGKQGARVFTPSCNVRYNNYPFYNASLIELPSSPPRYSPENRPPPPAGFVTGENNGGILTSTIIAIVVPVSVSVLLFGMGCILIRKGIRKYNTLPRKNTGVNEIVESLQFNLNTIQVATNNFSKDHKLGEDEFGEFYKGILPNGQEIAVKKLSRGSKQGSKEFKSEVLLLAKLQHMSLVRLLGFCLEGEEKILVYECVPNKSLDYFLIDEEKRRDLAKNGECSADNY